MPFYLAFILTLFSGFGEQHFDPELTLEVPRKEEEGRSQAGERKIRQPSPDRWGKTKFWKVCGHENSP